MTRYTKLTSGLCLALLIFTLTPKPTRADDRSQQEPIRLYAQGELGPIGAICSLTPFFIDGRLARGELAIWGGEQIQSLPSGARVKVRLDSIGQVTLESASAARLTRAFTGLAGKRRLLIASLISGQMTVELEQTAGAYVECLGSAFTASAGAAFRLGSQDGKATVTAAIGEVQVDTQAPQHTLKIRLVKPNPDLLKPPIDLGLRLDVETRAPRETQWQVTDENDKPVPDVPLLLTVVGNVGRFGNAATFSGTTNAQGIVSAPFTAGPSPASGTINASVPGTNVSSDVQVTVRAKPPLLKFLIAAAVAATTVIVITTRDKGPIEQAPPPTIVP